MNLERAAMAAASIVVGVAGIAYAQMPSVDAWNAAADRLNEPTSLTVTQSTVASAFQSGEQIVTRRTSPWDLTVTSIEWPSVQWSTGQTPAIDLSIFRPDRSSNMVLRSALTGPVVMR